MTESDGPLNSYAASPVENSQPPGIGRLVAIGAMVAWNNLGRNVVFAEDDLQPWASFAETLYPDDDELSQYDLDVHAILAVPEADLVVVLNHLGLLRAFSASEVALREPARRLHPRWTRPFAEDVERSVIVGNRLVGSGPRSVNATGVVVSEPLDGSVRDGPLATRFELESWGEVTALATVEAPREPAIAVGGPGHISLVPMTDGRAGRTRWNTDVPFRVAAFVSEPGVLWAAGGGLSSGVDDYDWESVRSGWVVAVEPASGRVIASAPLPEDVAWGNGGTAFALVGGLPCVLARNGAVCVAPRDLRAASDDPGALWRRSSPVAKESLGIAHAAVTRDRLLYGFNRGGYRLHAMARSAIELLARSPR